jgi:HEAT repeat protein
MSWYGKHPQYPKGQIKPLLPPGACKRCVYWFRTAIGSSPDGWHQEYPTCPRCGIPQWELLAQLNERLLNRLDPQTSDAASALHRWLNLYDSTNEIVKIRAARALVSRPDTPFRVLLQIYDNLSHINLGASAEKTLLKRNDEGLLDEMVRRLDSADRFHREMACNILGLLGDPTATPHLLRMIDDPEMMVRRAAAFGLMHLKDASAVPELERQLARRQNDDRNVVWALQCAIQSLGATADKTG